MNIFLKFFCFFLLSVSFSCKKQQTENKVQTLIDQVEKKYAPDARTALFNVEALPADTGFILKGESNLPLAIDELRRKLEENNISYSDSIVSLPDTTALDGKIKGIVKISVANLRRFPKHSSELVSQATLGTPLQVYQKQGGWYLVQTPDNYLAWVDYGGISPKSQIQFQQWKAKDKLIFLDTKGDAYERPDAQSQVISDLVAGNILQLVGEEDQFYKVNYPDDKIAFVKKEQSKPYSEWLETTEITGDGLVTSSKKLMGLPYLWGGTSPKGVDCSGFTKTVYFLNGMVIPRDASQQINTGILIDSIRNFKDLQRGDLLFFGKKATDSIAERVIHVGMWIDNHQFIHAMGDVHISSFDTSTTNFDQYNYDRYLRTKRIANMEDSSLIYLKNKAIFNKNQP